MLQKIIKIFDKYKRRVGIKEEVYSIVDFNFQPIAQEIIVLLKEEYNKYLVAEKGTGRTYFYVSELENFLNSLTVENERCEKCGELPCGNHPICCDCDPDNPCPACSAVEDD